MSLRIGTKYTRTLIDSNGKEIYEFPANTLLDNILPDLWNDIMKYIKRDKFILRNRLLPCPGFRKVTKDEFVILENDFMNYYKQNGGITNYQNTDYSQIMYFIVDGYYVFSYKNNSGSTTCEYSIDKTKILINLNNSYVSNVSVDLESKNIHMILMILDIDWFKS